MSFELNDEKAMDVLIWWIEGADGSIDYREEETVKEVLQDISYSLETYYQETLMHLGGLGMEDLNKLVEKAIHHGKNNFDHHRKQVALALLVTIAEANENVVTEQKEKIDRVRKAFGLEGLKLSDREEE